MNTNFNTMTHTRNRLALIASLVMATCAMTAQSTAAATYTAADVRIVAQDETLYDATVYVSSDGCTVADDTGTEHTVLGATALCALDAAASQEGFTYSLTYYDGFGFLLSTVGDYTGDWTNYWLYYVDNESPSVGMGDLVLNDGDELLLTYGGYNPPLRLTLDRTHRRANEPVTAWVEYYSYDWVTSTGAYLPVSGATVSVGEQTFTTDASGTVVLTLGSAGTYNVYAAATGYTRTADETIYGYRSFQAFNAVGKEGRAEIVADGLTYLLDQQDDNGLIGGSQSVTEWSAMAFAAAGKTSQSLFEAVRSYRPTSDDGASEIARHILALEAIGVDARSVDGANYVARLNNTFTDGQFGDSNYCNDDIFAVLALIAADEPFTSDEITGGVSQTLNCVNNDGGVGYAVDGSSDMDTTAAWLMMAARLKGHKDETGVGVGDARRNAVAYIRNAQHPDGGWGYNTEAASNASTTAWVLQSLRARHHEAKAMTTNHRNGFHFLNSMKRDSGAVKYDTAGSTSLETLNTAYGIMALTGHPMPVNKKASLKR